MSLLFSEESLLPPVWGLMKMPVSRKNNGISKVVPISKWKLECKAITNNIPIPYCFI